MDLNTLILYTIVAFFYVISPGPAIFLAIANSLTHNIKAVIYYSLGNICGLFLLSSLSILGLGALLATSAHLFLAVKIIGALYLLYLGVKQIRLAAKANIGTDDSTRASKLSMQKSKVLFFKEGFFLAATNPKPILFFTALFPQFLNVETNIALQFFSMTAIFMVLSFISLMSYAFIFKKAKNTLGKGTRMAWFHRLTGGIFVGMSIILLQLKQNN